jgi:hypothetical protein
MRPYWSDMTALFSILAYMVKHSDPDGLDMCFTIDSKKYNSRHTTNLVNALDSKGAQGSSNITFTLDSILNEYKTRLRSQTAQRSALSWWKKEVRPLNLYILTDGVWQPKCDVFPAIKNLVDLLVELKLDEKQVGIQFISFGNDSDGLNRLERLDSGLNLKL